MSSAHLSAARRAIGPGTESPPLRPDLYFFLTIKSGCGAVPPRLSRPLMDSPFSSKELLALQVQAFLNAAEDVDVEPETIEDLLDTLTAQEREEEAQPESANNGTVGAQGASSATEAPRTILDITGDDNSSDDPDYVDDGPEDDEIDISSLYAAPQEQEISKYQRHEYRLSQEVV